MRGTLFSCFCTPLCSWLHVFLVPFTHRKGTVLSFNISQLRSMLGQFHTGNCRRFSVSSCFDGTMQVTLGCSRVYNQSCSFDIVIVVLMQSRASVIFLFFSSLLSSIQSVIKAPLQKVIPLISTHNQNECGEHYFSNTREKDIFAFTLHKDSLPALLGCNIYDAHKYSMSLTAPVYLGDIWLVRQSVCT